MNHKPCTMSTQPTTVKSLRFAEQVHTIEKTDKTDTIDTNEDTNDETNEAIEEPTTQPSSPSTTDPNDPRFVPFIERRQFHQKEFVQALAARKSGSNEGKDDDDNEGE
jgi:hypothetical protein